MKKFLIPILTISILGLSGCAANLVVENAMIDFTAKTVNVKVKNIGNKDAGPHLTYIEINEVGAPDAVTPQSLFSVNVAGITAGSSWSSGSIPFSVFLSPRGLNLSTFSTANLVVRADAKNMVKESNEDDNIYNANH